MKLRIKGDSIRMRLTRGEVRQLLESGRVADGTHFPDGEGLRYELIADAAATRIDARCAACAVVVMVPKAVLDKWASSEEVAVRAEIALGAGRGALLILVEKDFPCLAKRPDEDDSDAFARAALRVGR